MSTSWDLYCRDCDAELGMSHRWPGDVVSIWKRAEHLAALHELGDAVDLRVPLANDAHGLLEFAARHLNHDVIPRNEYGDCFDECTTTVTCAECGAPYRCRLKEGHEGPCSHKDPDT